MNSSLDDLGLNVSEASNLAWSSSRISPYEFLSKYILIWDPDQLSQDDTNMYGLRQINYRLAWMIELHPG